MGFAFRFETLLQYRNHLKEKAEVDLAQARLRLKEARESLHFLRKQLRETNASLETRIKKRIPSEEMRAVYDYLGEVKQRIAAQEIEVARRERLAVRRMETLLTRSKETGIMEKVKEKDWQQWQGEQLQAEQKIMDEAAVLRHGKRFP